MRTVPFSFDTFPRSRRPDYPRLRGELRTRVLIIGGGLTGCACALSFATAGVHVTLVEADRIGAGATAASAGLLRQDFDASFQETAARHGLRAARHLWQSMRRASLDFAAAIRRLGIRCDLAPQDLLFVTRDGSDAARRLKREYQARRDAGLDVTWLNGAALKREVALDAGGALRIKGDAFDPYRACVGLAAAAVARGAVLHEHTAVKRVRAGRKGVQIKTDAALVAADFVVIATGAPIDDLRALRRHFAPRQTFVVVTESLPAAVKRQVGRRTAALRDTASPPHLLRWMKDDRVLFSGADQAPLPARAREKTLVQRSGQLMYELTTLYPAISGLQPAWAWDLLHHESPDGLPVVGLHRNFPRHLFALGHARHGAGVAWLAARVLLRELTGEPSKGDALFGFSRIL
jgi:glycine/D-amino acid oxidase-like deaminating enzyme